MTHDPSAIRAVRSVCPPIPAIVMQHIEQSAHLRLVRSVLVRAPRVRLLQLARLDARLAAHLDGVAAAGDCGVALAQQALERPGQGELFLAAVRAIEDHDVERLDKLLALAETVTDARAGLISAFGWTRIGVKSCLLPSARLRTLGSSLAYCLSRHVPR